MERIRPDEEHFFLDSLFGASATESVGPSVSNPCPRQRGTPGKEGTLAGGGKQRKEKREKWNPMKS